MKNAVFCDLRTQFILHRRHITSPLRSPINECYVRFEVFAAVTMKNAFFSDLRNQEKHHLSATEPIR
jgi:hypothetical protein